MLKFKRFIGGTAKAVIPSSTYRKLAAKRVPPEKARITASLAKLLIDTTRRSK